MRFCDSYGADRFNIVRVTTAHNEVYERRKDMGRPWRNRKGGINSQGLSVEKMLGPRGDWPVPRRAGFVKLVLILGLVVAMLVECNSR